MDHFMDKEVALPAVNYHGTKVVTLDLIDRVHRQPSGSAANAFHENRGHFIEGEDFFELDPDEAGKLRIVAPSEFVLISESGYILIVKTFDDDLAWRVHRHMVNSARQERYIGGELRTLVNDPNRLREALLQYEVT